MGHKSAKLAALALAAACVVGALLPTSASAATAVPYTDPSATGYLGFCNAKDQQITSGPINEQPFTFKAVASQAAPTNYGPPYGHAVLYAYQPIQYVDPSNWSGKQLTAATAFTNGKAPMAVGTQLDPSIAQFAAAFPLHLQGFAQVRMYFTAFGQTEYSTTYPAANIKISGNTWTQVGGGKVNCKAGQAHSNEIAPGAPSTFPASHKTPTPTSPGGVGATGATSGAGASAGSTAANPSSSANPGAVADQKSSSSSSGAVVAIVLVALVVVAGGVGYVFLRRRRHGAA